MDDVFGFHGANPGYLGILCGWCTQQCCTDVGVCSLCQEISTKGVPVVIVIVSQVHKQSLGADADAILVLGRVIMAQLGQQAVATGCYCGP